MTDTAMTAAVVAVVRRRVLPAAGVFRVLALIARVTAPSPRQFAQ
ncbi:hypothetical protein ACFWIP_33535 [Streptomyces anulatus]